MIHLTQLFPRELSSRQHALHRSKRNCRFSYFISPKLSRPTRHKYHSIPSPNPAKSILLQCPQRHSRNAPQPPYLRTQRPHQRRGRPPRLPTNLVRHRHQHLHRRDLRPRPPRPFPADTHLKRAGASGHDDFGGGRQRDSGWGVLVAEEGLEVVFRNANNHQCTWGVVGAALRALEEFMESLRRVNRGVYCAVSFVLVDGFIEVGTGALQYV